jgi:hypothetical protein
MSEKETRFVLCINNIDCDDLEVRKIYEVLPDEDAAEDNYLRIIDDSGEDYLYPADYFFPVEISSELRETLRHAA